VKKLAKPGAPSDRPVAVLLRFLSRVVALVKRRGSETSSASASSDVTAACTEAAAVGVADD
jgi:hypothetical protein